VLQCVAVCCSVLQCVAVCCSVLQCVAVCCSVLPWPRMPTNSRRCAIGVPMNESGCTCEWVMSYMWISRCHMRNWALTNESWHAFFGGGGCATGGCPCHVYERWSRVNIWKYLNESRRTYERVISWMYNESAHMNESSHTPNWVVSQLWVSHVTHMDESWHTCTRVCACERMETLYFSCWIFFWVNFVRVWMRDRWSYVKHDYSCAHISMGHVTRVTESCSTSICRSRVTQTQDSYRTNEGVMCETWLFIRTHNISHIHTCINFTQMYGGVTCETWLLCVQMNRHVSHMTPW